MNRKKERRAELTSAILSLSMLTVMAGAAVAPALSVIHEHFRSEDQALVQMIISMPALFIFLTNMIFPKLCSIFRAKELTMAGLIIYVAIIMAGMDLVAFIGGLSYARIRKHVGKMTRFVSPVLQE